MLWRSWAIYPNAKTLENLSEYQTKGSSSKAPENEFQGLLPFRRKRIDMLELTTVTELEKAPSHYIRHVSSRAIFHPTNPNPTIYSSTKQAPVSTPAPASPLLFIPVSPPPRLPLTSPSLLPTPQLFPCSIFSFSSNSGTLALNSSSRRCPEDPVPEPIEGGSIKCLRISKWPSNNPHLNPLRKPEKKSAKGKRPNNEVDIIGGQGGKE